MVLFLLFGGVIADRRDAETDPRDHERDPTLNASPAPGREVMAWVAAGSTSNVKMRSEPVISLASAAATPRRTRNTTANTRVGTPAAPAASGSTDREEQRTGHDCEHAQRRGGDDDEHTDLGGRDPEERAEQQSVDATEVAAVQRGEQEAARESECLHDGDDGRLFAERSGTLRGYRRDHSAAADAEGEEAELCRYAEERRPGRAGEADERKRVAGEGLTAQHHEPSDGAGEHHDDRPGAEGVDHELELEEIAHDVHGAWRSW